MTNSSPGSFVLAIPSDCQLFGGFECGNRASHIQFNFDGDQDDIHLLLDRPVLENLGQVVQRLLATPEPQGR
jgi:hypothetical protein